MRVSAKLKVEVSRRVSIDGQRLVPLDLPEFSVGPLDFVRTSITLNTKHVVLGSVALEDARGSFYSNETKVSSEDQNGPVDELKNKLAGVVYGVLVGGHFAVGSDGDILSVGTFEGDHRSHPLYSELGGWCTEVFLVGNQNMTITDVPELLVASVDGPLYVARAIGAVDGFHLEDFRVGGFTLVGSDFTGDFVTC